jgi:hypothetical protein
VTYKGAGTTGFYADYNHLTQNFLLANYESSQSIDNDDGSAVSDRAGKARYTIYAILHTLHSRLHSRVWYSSTTRASISCSMGALA